MRSAFQAEHGRLEAAVAGVVCLPSDAPFAVEPVDRDPLSDITELGRVRFVIKGGVVAWM